MLGKRAWTSAVALAAVVVTTAGCTSGSPDTPEKIANNVVIGIAEPSSLLPSDTIEPNGSEVLSSLFYPLVRFDAANQPQLVAAASIRPDKTNTVWTIKLKPGFTFSNGEPVAAQNYLDAWNYGAYGPNGQAASYYFSRIDGYAAMQAQDPDGDGPQKAPAPAATTLKGLARVDDLTFTVTLSEPFAGWESVLGYDSFYPLPKAAFASPGVLAKGFDAAPVGNGPFKLDGAWEHGQQIQVVRAAGFKGEAPKVDGILWKIYRTPTLEYADLVAGQVDVQTQIPLERLSSARTDLGARLQQSSNSTFQFVGFPTYEKQFQDPRVRRAISMAIDRKAMTDQVFLGSQTPATAFVSPVVTGYRANSCGESCRYDPVKAKKLYAEAHGPASITLSYNQDNANKAWVDLMCGQLKASLGVDCVGAGGPSLADLLKRVEAKEQVGLVRLVWTMDYPLMEDYLSPLYSTGGSSNYSGYSNSAFDSLVKDGSEARTPADAIRKWQQAEDILAQDMPVIPLRFGRNVFGSSPKVTNVSVDRFQKVDVYKIQLAG